MGLDDKDQYIRELEQKIEDHKHKEQNDKLDQISEKLESMEKKINHSDKLDDDTFKDAKNNYATNDIIKDDKVRKILSSSEMPVSHVRYSGKLFGGQYDKVVITNKRIIFYKTTGTFSKKIKYESVPLDKLEFPTVEEKGLISKKAILKVEIGMEEPLRWEGNPTDIQGLNQEILSVVRR